MTPYRERLNKGAYSAKKAAQQKPVEKIPDEADKPAESAHTQSRRKGRHSA